MRLIRACRSIEGKSKVKSRKSKEGESTDYADCADYEGESRKLKVETGRGRPPVLTFAFFFVPILYNLRNLADSSSLLGEVLDLVSDDREHGNLLAVPR